MNNKAYDEGRKAFSDGKDIDSNPYGPDGENYDLWQDGWWDAQDEACGGIEPEKYA